MARFGNFDQYLDNAGDPLADGKLYFYESGTTTAKNTFADVNNSIPNTNPVILTAAGRQPNIFFNGVAKVILTDKNDVQIAVRDPVGETDTDFGDEWVASKIYSSDDVVLGSNGVYYRSLSNGNQNNNPVTSTGFWTLLYSVEWNSGITYDVGAVVTYDNQQYQSLQGSNLNQNPSTASSYWVSLAFAWLSTTTYSDGMNAVGTDGVLYTSLQDSNTGNDPATSPAYWVGTSAAAAASATAAAASATAAAASETAAETAETNAETAQAAAEAAQAAAETAETNAETAETGAEAAQAAAEAAQSAAETAQANAETAETNAETAETNAEAAQTAAEAAQAAAETAQTGAETAETNAETAQAAAEAAQAAAETAETNAETAETNAETAQTAAEAAQAAAETAESNAATSASNASASEGNASDSADAAAASAVSAAASYDAFDDRYLGDKASDPTLDNDGNALLTGALYFNTTSDVMKVYDGSAWNIAAISSASPTFTGTVTADGLSLGDNDKATFGASNDLEIYSDGANSFIQNYTGNLQLDTFSDDRDIFIKSDDGAGGSATYLQVDGSTGSINLRHYGNVKLATTATGIDVTGTATMDGLTVDVTDKIDFGGGLGEYASSPTVGTVGFTSRGSVELFTDSNNNGASTGDAFVIYDGAEYGGATKNLLKITKGNDISFYEDTGTTPKFFWDASAESLGIGTTSPDEKLEIEDGNIKITNTVSNESRIYFTHSTSADRRAYIGALETDGNGNSLIFAPNANGFDGSEAMRIDSSGNVGIGTSSPSYPLVIGDGTDSTEYLSIESSTTGTAGILFGDTTPARGGILYDNSNNSMAFRTGANTEAMRINSAGDILINQTGTGDYTTIVGSSFRASGFSTHTSSENAPLLLNRLSTDGDIAIFRKDNTTVGSIGTTTDNGLFRILDTTNRGFSIRTSSGETALEPSTTVAQNGYGSIGSSNGRWKDLYLSGGVYLGGTGAANKLDDYETGTWTPTVQGKDSNPTVTYTTQEGNYTKIGRLVTVEFEVELSAISGGSGFLIISGLPFVPVNNNSRGSVDFSNVTLDTARFYNLTTRSTTTDDLVISESRTGNAGLTIDIPDLSATSKFIGSITYPTS